MTKFTDLSTFAFDKTLARKLIPVADGIRDLFSRFGTRPYKVRLVRVVWSSGTRGAGAPVVQRVLDILPTPLVQDLSTMTEIVHPIGLDEVGTIVVSEISGRFTDEELRFLDKAGDPPGPDTEVFWEIEFPRPDGLPGDLRRFYLRSAPMYFSTKFYWMVRLEKAHNDRDRNGDYD
jgi:hypothetical protein